VLGQREVAMRIGARVGGWGRRSQERALDNAREATTALSRARVQREEIELYLRSRRAGRGRTAEARRPA
jgi:hypothetical protein